MYAVTFIVRAPAAQTATVRFAEEPEDREIVAAAEERFGSWDNVLSYSVRVPDEDPMFGHCDSCGAPCDRRGCTADRGHVAAIPS